MKNKGRINYNKPRNTALSRSGKRVQRIPMGLEDLDYLARLRADHFGTMREFAEWVNHSQRAILYFEGGYTQSPRLLCYYLNMMDKDELRAFITKLIWNDKGGDLVDEVHGT